MGVLILSEKFKILKNIFIYLLTYFVVNIITVFLITIILGDNIEDLHSESYFWGTIASFVTLFIYSSILKKSNSSLLKQCNFQKISIKTFLSIIIITILLSITTEYFILKLDSISIFQNSKSSYYSSDSFLWIICAIILGPIYEEILFRGLIYNEFKKTFNSIVSIIIQSLIFSIMHFDLVQIIYTAVLGIFLALLYTWSQSIIAPIIAHISFNFFGTYFTPYLPSYAGKNFSLYVIFSSILFTISLRFLYKSLKNEKLTNHFL